MYDNTIFMVLLLLILLLYMLPTLIAYARDIRRRRTLAVLNIVAGWTLIGWIVAFLWARMAQSQLDELA